MQAEILSPEQALTDAQRAKLEALSSPFDPSEVEWRVTATTNNDRGRSGLVLPYADPRAYADRLNKVVTISGWAQSFSVMTVAPLTRQKKENGKTVSIPTGKIIVTGTVTISGLGTHSSTGEAWADDDNGMTSAEAQAFKRSCACFGLGRYFYDFEGKWVALDANNKIVEKPKLPSWALPKPANQSGPAPMATVRSAPSTSSAPGGQRGQTSTSRPAPAQKSSTTVSVWINKWIEHFEERLGPQLYLDIVTQVRNEEQSMNLSLEQTRERAIEMLELAERGLLKIRTIAEAVGAEAFHKVLDAHRIPSMSEFPNLQAEINVFRALQALANNAPTTTSQAA